MRFSPRACHVLLQFIAVACVVFRSAYAAKSQNGIMAKCAMLGSMAEPIGDDQTGPYIGPYVYSRSDEAASLWSHSSKFCREKRHECEQMCGSKSNMRFK